jgi:Suppressor of fused protein (SUFU)
MGAGSPSDDLRDEHREGPPQAVHITESYADALEAHYKSFFGIPSRIVLHEIRSLCVHVDTYIYPPTEDRPFTTAATVGMSALPLETSMVCAACRAALEAAGTTPQRRSELLMYLDPNWDFEDPAGLYPILMLAYVARAPHIDAHAFGWGMTYGFPRNLVPEGSLLTDAYVMNPIFENAAADDDDDEDDDDDDDEEEEEEEEEEDFATLNMPDGEVCNIFWLIPITRAECYVKRTEGPGALNEILAENEYFLFDLDRKCFVEYENRAQRRARAKAQRRRAKRRPLAPVNELRCMDCGHTSHG